jgi:fatty-acyl-CoA synthase
MMGPTLQMRRCGRGGQADPQLLWQAEHDIVHVYSTATLGVGPRWPERDISLTFFDTAAAGRAAPARAAVRLDDPAIEIPTPTCNESLPYRRGGFSCLTEALDYAAHGETGVNFFDGRGRLTEALPWRVLRERAQAFARRLIGAGMKPEERLLVIADTWPGFCIAFFGAQYAHVVPVPVALPVGFGAMAGYVATLRRQITASGAAAVIAPDSLATIAERAAADTGARLAGPMALFDSLPDMPVTLPPMADSRRSHIQFSSGSTRLPVGVDILHEQLMANIDGALAAQDIGPDDSAVSWLPLYHDMGLIGLLLAPLCAQRSVDLMAPGDFARRPMQWLSMISRRRATVTYSPGFGYDLVARRAAAGIPSDIDLSCLQIAGIGADMIHQAALDRFATAFAGARFDRRAFLASYGMAELCVGLSFGRRAAGVTFDGADDGTRRFAVCGNVLPGHSVQIRDGEGIVDDDREVGRLFVRGPSVMPGYFGRPEASAAALVEGWLDTGDLGYWHAGELVITGRAKDLMIVNGRNIWPQDLEWAVEALPRLRRGDACAFAVDGSAGEEIVLLVQCPADGAVETAEMRGAIREAVRHAASIDCRIVLLSRRNRLPVTSSGKLSRTRARIDFLAGDLGDELPRRVGMAND